MLGMMNCNNDSVEFYAAPTSKRDSISEETRVFVERKDKKQVSYTQDGKKLIDGKPVETSDDESSPAPTPQQMWDKLIFTSVATGATLQKSELSKTPSVKSKTKTAK